LPKPRTRTATGPRLAGKIALITGASRGIGRALATALAAEGCDLILTSRHVKSLETPGREVTRMGVRALLKACDVRDPASVKALAMAMRRHFRRVDILINNAGIAHAAMPVERLPYAQWKEVLDTNLTGTFLVTQAVLPLMKKGGTIVNNLSISATRVFPNSFCLQCLQARRARSDQHAPRRIARALDPGCRAHPRRYRHRDLESALAQRPTQKDDVCQYRR
jgi:NAD(P)-dependent dehydrogenase (short-subunit alcohol dehydrogenase family)